MSQLAPLLQRLRAKHPRSQSGADSGVPGVTLFWMDQEAPRAPLLYDSGVLILAQGSKDGFLGDRHFHYDAHTCMVFGVPVAFECATHATPQEPLLGLRLDVDPRRLHTLVARLDPAPPERPGLHSGVASLPMDQALLDTTERLLRTLDDPLDREILGPAAADELLYRVLRSPAGHVLAALTREHAPYARIASALEHIHRDYAEPVAVDQLAQLCGMSVSSFHRAFKQVTSDSPLQYVKKLRLLKAKSLLVFEQERVEQAAFAVGYASASQFSREFKRYFKVPPSQAQTLPYADPAPTSAHPPPLA
ncbi:MAG: AraC family transcriptional regulator [Myxococcota bacterium]|nr:AraC family transcriptional regulator [Myxococcota bacterium]